MWQALMADVLTGGRIVLAAALAGLLARRNLGAGAVVLAVAWASDAADGRAARASGRPTRLAAWDMRADVAVGIGVLLGLVAGGYLPALVAATALLGLGGGYVLLRNEALGMALQAVGYGALLWRLWADGVPARWVPVATALAIGLVDRERFTRIVLPEFFRGMGAAARLRRDASAEASGEDETRATRGDGR